MKLILKLEELGLLLLCIVLLYIIHADWWWYLIMFIGPDISMIGYAINNKMGSWFYNLVHHKGVAALILLSGILIMNNYFFSDYRWLYNIGAVLLGHSSMDRFFGYGLKYENGFKFTHLGEIGKK